MNDFSVNFGINPELDTAILNNISMKITETTEKFSAGNARVKELNELLATSGKLTNEEAKEYAKLTEQTVKQGKEIQNMNKQMEELKKSTAEVSKESEGIGKKFEGIGDIAKTALGVFVGGAALGGIQSLEQGIEHFAEKGLEVVKTNENLKQSFTLAGLSGAELNEQLKRTGENADKISNKFGVSAEEVKKTSAELGLMAGITGETNDKITEVATGITQLGDGMFSSTEVIRAFTKGGLEGSESLGRLNNKFPGLAKALEGCTTPAEKADAAMKYLKGSFDAIEGSPLTALKRGKEAINQMEEGVSGLLVSAILPLITSITGVLTPAIQWFTKSLENPIFSTIVTVIGTLAGMLGIAAIALAVYTTWQTICNSEWIVGAVSAAMMWVAALGPVGLVIAGIVAVIAIVIVLYNKFDWFRLFVKQVWEGIKFGVMEAWTFIKAYFVTPFDAFIAGIKGTGKVLSDIFHGDFKKAISDSKDTFSDMGNVIKKDINGALDESKKNIDNLRKGLDDAYNSEHKLSEGQKELDNNIKQSVVHLKELRDEFSDTAKDITDANNDITNTLNADINQNSLIRFAKYLSGRKDLEALYLANASEKQKKAYETAKLYNDNNLHDLDKQGQKYEEIEKIKQKAEDDTKRKILGTQQTSGKDLTPFVDSSYLDKYKENNDDILRLNKEFDKKNFDEKIRNLELLKSRVQDNMSLTEKERINQTLESDKKITSMKHEQYLKEIEDQNKLDISKNNELLAKEEIDIQKSYDERQKKIDEAYQKGKIQKQEYDADSKANKNDANDLFIKVAKETTDKEALLYRNYLNDKRVSNIQYSDDEAKLEIDAAKKIAQIKKDINDNLIANAFTDAFKNFNPDFGTSAFNDSKFREGIKEDEDEMNKHSISYQTYIDKQILLEHQKADAIKKINNDLWKEISKLTSDTFGNLSKAYAKKAEEDAKTAGKEKLVMQDITMSVIASGVQMAAEGAKFGKIMETMALNTLKMLIPIYLTQILAGLFASPVNLASADTTVMPEYGGISASIFGIMGKTSSSFHTGKPPDGSDYGTEIPSIILSSEAVMRPEVSSKDFDLYNWQNATARSMYDYIDEKPTVLGKILHRQISKTGHTPDIQTTNNNNHIEKLNNKIEKLTSEITIMKNASKEIAIHTKNANEYHEYNANKLNSINNNSKENKSLVHSNWRG